MRAIITGQVGMDKKAYLKEVADFAATQGEPIEMYHVGNMMYGEAPDIRPGRILDLPISRLNSLRRAAFKDIISDAPNHNHALVNTHATFRWRAVGHLHPLRHARNQERPHRLLAHAPLELRHPEQRATGREAFAPCLKRVTRP